MVRPVGKSLTQRNVSQPSARSFWWHNGNITFRGSFDSQLAIDLAELEEVLLPQLHGARGSQDHWRRIKLFQRSFHDDTIAKVHGVGNNDRVRKSRGQLLGKIKPLTNPDSLARSSILFACGTHDRHPSRPAPTARVRLFEGTHKKVTRLEGDDIHEDSVRVDRHVNSPMRNRNEDRLKLRIPRHRKPLSEVPVSAHQTFLAMPLSLPKIKEFKCSLRGGNRGRRIARQRVCQQSFAFRDQACYPRFMLPEILWTLVPQNHSIILCLPEQINALQPRLAVSVSEWWPAKKSRTF
jgi:hypothetical protein